MDLRFYIAFFRLAGEDRRMFEVLAEDDELIQHAIRDCGTMWREHMREAFPDLVQCRHVFLARTLIIATRSGIKCGYGANVAAAFALFLCDKVEQRVRALDFEAGESRWRFRK